MLLRLFIYSRTVGAALRCSFATKANMYSLVAIFSENLLLPIETEFNYTIRYAVYR